MSQARKRNAQDLRREEFERRVLAALETKPGRVAKTVNSPSFLWLLSLLLITVGGSWLALHQQCAKESDELGIRYIRLQREIFDRRLYIAEVLFHATSVDELKERLAHIPHTYGETKDRPIHDMQSELNRLAATRVDDSDMRSREHEATKDLAYKGRHLGQFGPLWNGRVPHDLLDSDMEEIREFGMRLGRSIDTMNRRWNVFGRTHDCGPSNLYELTTGNRSVKTVTIKGFF